MPTFNFPKLSSSKERTNAVSEPACSALRILDPEGFAEKRETEDEERYPFKEMTIG